MDTPQHFRTALNGFRREDVVSYLEYLNAKHVTEMNQLTADADSLRAKVSSLEEQLSQQAPDCSQELAELRAKLDAAASEKQALEAQVAALQENSAGSGAPEELASLQQRCRDLEAELSALKEAKPAEEDLAGQELEAYRRAERAERVANEKADLIYHRANAVLEEATGKIDGSSTELSELADRINAQLQQMQYAINSSKIALKTAVDTMHTLHSGKD